MRDTDKAKDREWHTGMEFGYSAMETILSALVPGAGAAVGMSRKVIDHLKARAESKEARRVEEFCLALLRPDNGNPAPGDADGEPLAADFETLLAALISDLEDEKADYYATFAKRLARREIIKDHIRPLIFALRELTLREINALQRSYVATKHKLIPARGPIYDPKLPTKVPGDPDFYGRRVMEHRGLTSGDQLTQYGMRFVEAVCSIEKLTPAAIGERVWATDCALISYEMDTETWNLQRLQEDLIRLRIKAGPIIAPQRNLGSSLGRNFILLAGPHFERMVRYKTHLAKVLQGSLVVAVLLPGADSALLQGLTITRCIEGLSFDNLPDLSQAIHDALLNELIQRERRSKNSLPT
ncbi:hypothetical protein [Achromobacter piechaudii]|uniref:Uncharacterized protein n=1 Tax=Achromobacter piechaudii TaxID=72556 RepID=A0A6S7EMN5_9BURK|nr:hypothetical protein [Achromobacter piechaudii]CAB3916202.1 hypothetical protein LMG1861_05096 [Achromobacter piechaudii]